MRSRVLLALIAILFVPGFAAAQPLIYVTNQATNNVHVLQSTDGLQVATIPVGQAPTGIALDSTGTFGYVANRGDNTVSRIDVATNTQGTVIAVTGNPTAVALTPDGSTAYVVQSTECSVPPPAPTPTPGATPTPGPSPSPSPVPDPICQVVAIDTATDTVIANIDVGNEPFDVAVSPSGGFAYVTNRADDTISVIDTSTNLVIDTIGVGDTPEGIAVGGGELYVTNDAANTVTVIREIDLQIVGTILVGAGPLGVAASPDGTRGIVSNDVDSSISVFEAGTQTLLGTIPVGTNPAGIAVFPNSAMGVVANTTGNSITVFSLDGLASATYPVFGSPAEVAVTPEPNISLTKGASPLPAPAGGSVTFSLVYTNIGTAAASNLLLTDDVPQYLTFLSGSGGAVLNGSTVEWTIASLPPGGSGTVTATYTVDAPLPTGTTTTNIADLVDGASGQAVQAVLEVPIDSDPSYDILASAPNPFVADGQATYTVTYSNLGTATSLGTQLEVLYDPALTFVSAVPPPDVGDNIWDIGSLPVGAGGTITVTVDIGSPLANGSTLTSEFTMSDVFGNDVTAQALNTVQSAPQLALSMTATPDPAPAGGVVLYDIVYSNPGTDSAQGVVLTTSYDPAIAFLAADVEPDDPSGTIWTIGEVPGGGSGRVRVQVVMPPIIPNGTLLSSTAAVTDGLLTANANVTTTVQSSPALGLALSDSPDPVLSGDPVTYTLTYSNTGGDIANGVTVSVTYPPQLSFDSAVPPPDGGTNNVWTIGTLAAGASGVISIVADAVAPNGSQATLTSVASDSLSNSATAQEVTVIDQIPALQVGISATPEPVLPANLVTYTISYGNTGTDVASGVELTQSLPAGVSFVSATPLPDFGTTDTWTIGGLGIGASGTVTVVGIVAPGLANGALLPCDVTLRDGAGQITTANVTSSVSAVDGIALASAANTDPVPPGGQVTYTISYANATSSTLIDAMASVVYDGNLSFVASNPAPASASNDFWLLGDIEPGQGGTIEVTVAVNGGVASGSVLASEVALSAAGGEFASVAQLSAVEATPGLAISMSALPTTTGPAGTVEVTIAYSNDGAAPVDNVSVIFDPGTNAASLATIPAVADLGSPTWNLGTLAPGANGTLTVTILTAAPAGGLVSLNAAAIGVGQSRNAVLHLVSVGSNEVEISKAQYRKGKKNNVQIQMVVDELPPSFTGVEEVVATISSPTQILAILRFPAGSLSQKGTGWKAKVLPAEGGKLQLGIKQKKDTWRIRVKAKKLPELPFSDSYNLTMSVGLGNSGFSTERVFSLKGPETPETQYLRYRGD